MIINCTPHPVTVRLAEGTDRTFTPSGIIPRVATVEIQADSLDGIPCVSQSTGEVEGLPAVAEGTFFIVSALVFGASARVDLIAPDTGKGAIRDSQGRILAVTRFIRR